MEASRTRMTRPMSAKASSRPSSAKPTTLASFAAARLDSGGNDGDLYDDLIVEDDDDDGDDFGAEALAAQRRLEEQLRRASPVSQTGKLYRPTSAPVHRGRPQSAQNHRSALEKQEQERERAAISLAYLKQAAEKKKQRDREFAEELLREETEYKKKMTQKVDQANRMSAALGSKRTFAMAPDRDGLHMVKIVDSHGSERVISVENFRIDSLLREFERLASVQIGQGHQRRGSLSGKTSSPPRPMTQGNTTTEAAPRKSKLRLHGIRTSRLNSSTSSVDLSSDLAFGSGNRPNAGNPKRVGSKATDRALVQEELKGVLASTIELTKVLQDQLHELKLKGWNFSVRTSSTISSS